MPNTLLKTLNADQRRAVANVRAAAERLWSRPLHRYYTDHTVAHSERIIALLDGLTAGMMTTDKRLAPSESLVLLAAAYLHDIGMQDERYANGDLEAIRAMHHELAAELIYRAVEDPAQAVHLGLPDDPGLVEAVALVAKGHRKVDLHAAKYEPLVHGGETLRLRLLAALLRFGDELDIDHRRVDLEQMKLLNLPVESQLHWWKCHYVSGVSIEDEYIRVAYRLPQGRPDYEGLIVPLVEGEIRARHAALEPIFRAHAVKVALGPAQVRLMRPVQPLPAEVEELAHQKLKASEMTTQPFSPPIQTNGQQTVRSVERPVQRRLELTMYDSRRNVLTKQLTLSIPPKDPNQPLRAEPVKLRLYLLNNSGEMARYIQIEMFVKARFLSYPYETTPLTIESASRWVVDKITDDKFRCFFEGGADLVCHTGEHYDLGYASMLVPCGEADGGAVTINIRYRIAAEKRMGSGLLIVWLQADAPVTTHPDKIEVSAEPPPLATSVRASMSKPTVPGATPSMTVFDQRGQQVDTQVNVAGDYVDQRTSPGGVTYVTHIQHAAGIAIGDGARVERPEPTPAATLPAPPGVSVSLLTRVVPTAYCHHLDADAFPLVQVALDNTGQGCANAALRVTAAIEGYSDVAMASPRVPQGEQAHPTLLPLLQPAAVATLNEIRPATLRVAVAQTAPTERILYDQTERIQLHARDTALLAVEAPDGSIVDLTAYLAAWVTPRRPEMEKLLRRAAEHHPDRQFVGYQGASNLAQAADVVREQARAIFAALKQDANLVYVNSPLSLGAQVGQITQRVRLPTESLAAGGSANCIDGTVLLASLLELAAIEPFIVVVPGHAFVGWRVWPGGDRYEFLETTMIGSAEFDAAQQSAQARYEDVLLKGYFGRGLFDPGGFARLIDVAACRAEGIYPLE